jgi:predicted nucleic acid-binding protein
MELVIDANILFSALIKDSFTSELLFEEELKLYTPEFIIDEFNKHEDLILQKTCRTREQFIEIMHCLKEVIKTIPEEGFSTSIKEAESISPDKDDVMYFALALKMKCGIWSNDKRLKEQSKLRVYSTKDIVEHLKN